MAELKVTKHNNLIETSYRLGAREQFFLLYLIANLSQRDQELPTYRLPFSNILKLMNFDGRRRIANVKDLEKMMDNLNTAPIKFVDGDEDVKIAWITELRYNRKTKDVAFTLNPNLKEYLLNLKGFFTNYDLLNVVNLSSHSIRLYELLKRHEYRREKTIIFKVDFLKSLLGIEDKYPEFYEFKRWVLQSAQEELENYTDLRFLYSEYEKNGKRVVGLRFEIFQNEPKEQPNTVNLLEKFRLSDSEKPFLITAETRKTSARKSEKPPTEFDRLSALTWSQHKAFEFLTEQGVNAAFVLDKILSHPKIKYSELVGFEDVYCQTIWRFLKNKSTAQQLAGAFVSWWKNEKFTTDAMHAKFLEAVIIGKKKMRAEELDLRKSAAAMPHGEFENAQPSQANEEPEPRPEPRTAGGGGVEQNLKQVLADFSATLKKERTKPFDFEVFKKEQPEIFEQMRGRAAAEYENFYRELGKPFDAAAMATNIEVRAKTYCEEWVAEGQQRLVK